MCLLRNSPDESNEMDASAVPGSAGSMRTGQASFLANHRPVRLAPTDCRDTRRPCRTAAGHAQSLSGNGDIATAIALDPEVARYHFDLGMAHFYATGYEQAVASFNTAIDLDSTLTLAYYYRGQSAYLLQDYDLALESYEKSWDLGYCNSMMVDQLVVIYQQRNDLDAVRDVQNRTC